MITHSDMKSCICAHKWMWSFHKPIGMDSKTSPRRRVYSTSQIVEYNQNMKKTYTPSDPSSVEGKNTLRRAKVQELNGQTSPDYGAQWKTEYQVSAESVILLHWQQIWLSTLETGVRSLCPLFLLCLSLLHLSPTLLLIWRTMTMRGIFLENKNV